MPKNRVSRRALIGSAVPLVAAGPLAKLALGSDEQREASHAGHDHPHLGHAAMIGAEVPAPGGPHDLDHLLYPPYLPNPPVRSRLWRKPYTKYNTRPSASQMPNRSHADRGRPSIV